MFLHSSKESLLFFNQNVYFVITDRLDGLSSKAFSSLNLGLNIGDSENLVEQNRALALKHFYKHFHITPPTHPKLYYTRQVHSNHAIVLDSTLESNEASVCVGEGDAIITNLTYTPSLVLVADCNPILLYDSANKAMATIHAGRKGVFSGIISATFAKMQHSFGTRASDCLMYVGASIRACCYEVGADVIDEINKCVHLRDFRNEIVLDSRLDLIKCITIEAQNLGINAIEVSPHCSCCNKNLYSYRREGQTGRFGLIAMLC